MQKATSVHESGDEDGFCPEAGYFCQTFPGGVNRLVVSVSAKELKKVHTALVAGLKAPLGFLYRQHVNRQEPAPEGTPPQDWVSIQMPAEAVLAALGECDTLVYRDSRGEFWIRGAMDSTVVLDQDGLIFCYPDDVGFRETLEELGLSEGDIETIRDRNFVKHWFHAEADHDEQTLISALQLSSTPTYRA